MGDAVVIIMIVLGILMGFIRRFIRLIMSLLVACVVMLFTPAVYDRLGFYFSSFGLGAQVSDGIGFLLSGFGLLMLFEFMFRWAFKDTTLPRLRFLDRLAGALVGIAWGIGAAAIFLVPLSYLGAVSKSNPGFLASYSQLVFRAFTPLLKLIYGANMPVAGWW